MGILAIPLVLERDIMVSSTSMDNFTEVKIQDSQNNQTPLLIQTKPGNHYFLYKLEPGKYSVAGFRRVFYNYKRKEYYNDGSFDSVQGNPYFHIETGKITILPYVFFTQLEYSNSGTDRVLLRDIFFKRYKDKQILTDLIIQKKEAKNWEIIWPQLKYF